MTPDQMKELAAQLREHARRPHGVLFDTAADLIEQMAQANLPISEVRAAADLIEKTKQLCACGVRPKADCPGEWEQGCDLGANEKFVARAQRVPLTDEQIEDCLPETIHTAEDGWLRTTAQTFHDFARAIEEAHGIRSEK